MGRLRIILLLSIAIAACAGRKHAAPEHAAPKHAAHGHAVALVERSDGSGMLDRVEDEDTHWVDLPDFGECPYQTGEIPPFKAVDDAHVPALDPARARQTNMDAGDETIHNEALLRLLDHATTEVLGCVSVSACYDTRALEAGTIDLKFEVAPNGDVRGVDVELTEGLDHTGVRECSRVAIWDTHFPAFDGADMVVDYRLDID